MQVLDPGRLLWLGVAHWWREGQEPTSLKLRVVCRAGAEAARAWDLGMLVHRSATMSPSHALGSFNHVFTEYLQDSDAQVRLSGAGLLMPSYPLAPCA